MFNTTIDGIWVNSNSLTFALLSKFCRNLSSTNVGSQKGKNFFHHWLEVAQKTKYLHVQIDCSLDLKEQIQAVSAKVSRALGLLSHAKNFLPKQTLKTLYTGVVKPHFQYCCFVWGCCGSAEINQLQKLQNRATRIVTNSSFDTQSRPLIKELGWNTIEKLK